MDDEANRPIKALLTMDDIVTTLENEGEQGVTAIAEAIDRPPSIVHDYLSTLRQLGYVVQDDDTGAYELSFRYLNSGTRPRRRNAVQSGEAGSEYPRRKPAANSSRCL